MNFLVSGVVLIGFFALSACGGGNTPSSTSYTIGGTISGLIGAVVLQNNGADDLLLSGDGEFGFVARLSDGADYSITVQSHPSGQACSVSNGIGTLSGHDVTSVAVNCGPAAPLLTMTPRSIKIFRFAWTDVVGEAEYRLFENLDGTSGYAEIATISADTEMYDREVFLPTHINASYLLQACGDNGCVDSAPVNLNGDITDAVGYIKASNSGAGDVFGREIVISGDGNTLAVSAVGEDSSAKGINGNQADEDAPQSGAVYIFTKDNNVWVQQAYVKASNAETYDWFGSRVALSGDGNTLAVSASGEDSSATGINGDQTNGHPIEDGNGDNDPDNKCCWSDSITNSGAVYIFVRSNETWAQQAYVKASNTNYLHSFGESIALSDNGDTLAVGNSFEGSSAVGINGDQADISVFGSGAVYVFSRESGIWGQQAYIKASRSEEYMRFGISVALSADGDTLSVGAPDDLSNLTDHSSGTVYIFTRSDENWNQQAFVKASNAEVADWFGASVDLSADGNTLAVGALWESSDAVGINGDQANNNAEQSGAVYIFLRNADSWEQQAYIKASNTEAFDGFGGSIDLSVDGNTLAVNAYEASNAIGINGNQDSNEAFGSGAVYLFTRDSSMWTQRAYIKASNTEEGDNFGSVALSADGNSLAISAVEEDSNATGINGDQADNSAINSGAVYLY